MKSFIKVSMLLGAASFLATGSANARGMIVNDEYNGLPQEVTEQSNTPAQAVSAPEEQSAAVAIQPESVEQAAPVEPVESADAASVQKGESVEAPVVAQNTAAASETADADTKSGKGSDVAVSEAKPEDNKDNTFETASMSSEDLDENRGAYSPSSASYLLANSTNNSVNNSVTGGNVISEGAFNSSSGLVNVIQNSGNNVLIQSSTVVNVQMIQ